MIALQILVGMTAAVGVGFILADVMRVPSYRASAAISGLAKKGKKQSGVLSVYIKSLAAKLAVRLKLNEFRRTQLELDLRTAGMEITPEQFIAEAVVSSLILGVCALLFCFFFPFGGVVLLAAALYVYFYKTRSVTQAIRTRRQAIEYELPRLVSVIANMLRHNRDVVSVLSSYCAMAGPELGSELEVTIADMRSGNIEVALTRLESRIGSTMMSDVVRGLISVSRGNDTDVYWAQTEMKFSDYQRQLLKSQAASVPRKVRRLSMALLLCFLLIYIAVIGQVLMTSVGSLF